jgi:hypothetical protein
LADEALPEDGFFFVTGFPIAGFFFLLGDFFAIPAMIHLDRLEGCRYDLRRSMPKAGPSGALSRPKFSRKPHRREGISKETFEASWHRAFSSAGSLLLFEEGTRAAFSRDSFCLARLDYFSYRFFIDLAKSCV